MGEKSLSQAVAFRDALRLTGIATATPSGTQNNYAPTGIGSASLVLLAPTAALTITGLSAGQGNGRVVLLANTSSSEYITLVNGSLGSTSTNRFAMPEDYVIPPLSGVMLVYSTSDNRWHMFCEKPRTIARIYTSSTTWNPPTGLIAVTAICIGAGGGGGAGCTGAAGSLRRGGWSGAGGGWSERIIPAAAISGSKIVNVGDGGTGGAGSASAGNGQDGQPGGDSEFDVMLRAGGGGGGLGGTNVGLGGSVAPGGLGTLSDGTEGASSGAAGGAGSSLTTPSRFGGGAGGPGGGVTIGNVASAGAAGTSSGVLGPIVTGGSGGGAGVNGGPGNSGAGSNTTGAGGGGGGSSSSAAAGDGGAGGLYGGGGGGGGAAVTGRTSGDGGAGADGLVIVIEHY